MIGFSPNIIGLSKIFFPHIVCEGFCRGFPDNACLLFWKKLQPSIYYLGSRLFSPSSIFHLLLSAIIMAKMPCKVSSNPLRSDLFIEQGKLHFYVYTHSKSLDNNLSIFLSLALITILLMINSRKFN